MVVWFIAIVLQFSVAELHQKGVKLIIGHTYVFHFAVRILFEITFARICVCVCVYVCMCVCVCVCVCVVCMYSVGMAQITFT
jgi:hypothetical protein